ncbi:hypothetical protein A6X20_01230 [Bradyrhizobium elkanii]|nr:hypothetical protein A6452_16520 [Bradyrhizobium elkanii]ODM86292.1 hypothetical protein A6X20_01230 [Bradyrhizobium elkanii]
MAADETGTIDLRPENPGSSDPAIRRLMVGRLQHLEKMGLAASELPGNGWLGSRPSVACATSACVAISFKTMHRAFTERGEPTFPLVMQTAS